MSLAREVIRTAILAALCILLGLAGALLWADRESLRREVERLRRAPPIVSERIREVVRETPGPVRTEIRIVDRPVPVQVERVVERVDVRPGETKIQEKVITVTEPVPCRTEDECRRMFAQAPQRVLVEARLPAGTPVPIEVDGDVREVKLARDVPLRIDLVQAEGGVFVAVQRPDSPIAVDRVTTETRVTVTEPQQSRWRLVAAWSNEAAVGVGYELVRASPVSLDVAALWSPATSSVRIGAGLSYGVSDRVSIGAMYATDQRVWVYAGLRF